MQQAPIGRRHVPAGGPTVAGRSAGLPRGRFLRQRGGRVTRRSTTLAATGMAGRRRRGRHILGLCLALLASLLQVASVGYAHASVPAAAEGRTAVLCTPEGLRTVVLDGQGRPASGQPAPAGRTAAHDCLSCCLRLPAAAALLPDAPFVPVPLPVPAASARPESTRLVDSAPCRVGARDPPFVPSVG
ncbi:MAG: hypothetical protein R3F55_19855 [Alphaproteobacteria bacterium]